MTINIRIKNLHLLRYLCGTNTEFTAALGPKIKAVTLKGMLGGYTSISDEIARQIEDSAYLPTGWMDRDNEGAIRMGPLDYAIHHHVLHLPPAEKERIRALIVGK